MTSNEEINFIQPKEKKSVILHVNKIEKKSTIVWETDELNNEEIENKIDSAMHEEESQSNFEKIYREDVFKAISLWVTSGEWLYTNATDYLKKRISDIPKV